MLKQKIFEDLKLAMKTGDTAKRDVLRMLDSMIKNTETELKKREEGLNDDEVLDVIGKAVKQRRDAISQYSAGGRSDLAEKETKEVDVLTAYLPAQLDEEEIARIVSEVIQENKITSKSEAGRLMGVLMSRLKGKADGNLVRKIVEEQLP